MWLFNSQSVHVVAILLIILEAISDTLVDSIVFIIAYPVYYHMPAAIGAGALPYVGAYLIPSRRVYRFIIILYVPVVCLWKAGRKVLRSRHRSAVNGVTNGVGVDLPGSELLEDYESDNDGEIQVNSYYSSEDDDLDVSVTADVLGKQQQYDVDFADFRDMKVSEGHSKLQQLIADSVYKHILQPSGSMKFIDRNLLSETDESIACDVENSAEIVVRDDEEYDALTFDKTLEEEFEDERSLQEELKQQHEMTDEQHMFEQQWLQEEQHVNEQQNQQLMELEDLKHLQYSNKKFFTEDILESEFRQKRDTQKKSSHAVFAKDREPCLQQKIVSPQQLLIQCKLRRMQQQRDLQQLQQQLQSEQHQRGLIVACWYNALSVCQFGWKAVAYLYREIDLYTRYLFAPLQRFNSLRRYNISLKGLVGWKFPYFTDSAQSLNKTNSYSNNSVNETASAAKSSVLSDRNKLRAQYNSSRFNFWLRPRLRGSISWGELVHLSDDKYQNVLCHYNNRWTLYRKIPHKSLSRVWGRISQWVFPVWLRKPGFSLYIWLYNCRIHEAAVQDLTQYKSFSDFFRRVLKPGVRPICTTAALTSPADGTVLYCGPVKSGCLEQVKDVVYSLEGFLGPLDFFLPLFNGSSYTNSRIRKSAEKFKPAKFYVGVEDDEDTWLTDNRTLSDGSSRCKSYPIHVTSPGGLDTEIEKTYVDRLLFNPTEHILHQCVIYLAPGDYHRFHSPADWTVYARRHFPGELFSVNPGVARWLQGLFNFNERAMYVGRWKYGFFTMTAVGATNVGSINVNFDKDLTTNTATLWEDGSFNDCSFMKRRSKHRGRGVMVRKGEMFGDFNLGSTIVLLFEAPRDFEFTVKPGTKIKYGQALGGYEAVKLSSAAKRGPNHRKW